MASTETYEYEQARIALVERYLESLTGTSSRWNHTSYGHVLQTVTKAASECDDMRPLEGRVDLAIDYLDSLRYALGVISLRGVDTLDFWSHRPNILTEIKEHRALAPDRGALEQCVGHYLDLPFRSSTIDRTLVDALTAMELISYGELVYQDFGPLFRGPYAQTLAKRPARELAISIIIEAALFSVLALGLSWLAAVGYYPTAWTPGSLVVLAMLFTASGIIGILRYPRYSKRVSEAKEAVIAPLTAMLETYMSLSSSGPLSLQRVRSSIDNAAAANVVWPASLYALLDDIATRSNRL